MSTDARGRDAAARKRAALPHFVRRERAARGPRSGLLLGPALLLLPLLCAACEDRELDARWLADKTWEDGAAVVSVYRGRVMRYGHWREAEVRDYVIREYLDRDELTKRDEPAPSLLPVLKANRHVTFSTGTYDYRLMASLFFDRRSGRLVKGVGTSQEGCGIAFQRWDRGGTFSYDTYWEGEGAGRRPLAKKGLVFFEDELFFLAAALPDGAEVTVLPSLLRSNLRGWAPRPARVARQGRITRVGEAEFEVDDKGFLVAWKIPGAQEFRRVARKRLYYWQHTKPGDEKLLR